MESDVTTQTIIHQVGKFHKLSYFRSIFYLSQYNETTYQYIMHCILIFNISSIYTYNIPAHVSLTHHYITVRLSSMVIQLVPA